MIAATDLSGGYFFVFLRAAEIVSASSLLTRPEACVAEPIKRSYADMPSWCSLAPGIQIDAGTAQSENAPVMVGSQFVADDVAEELATYFDLPAGWDGAEAAKPNRASILDAIRFVRTASQQGLDIEPTLHVDGSVVLEIGDEGSVRFLGDGRAAYAFDGRGYGVVAFDGFTIPQAIGSALNV